MTVTDDDIDALYGTPRRRVVAKALRPHLPGESARGLLGLAAAALFAVDEDINEREINGEAETKGRPVVDGYVRLAAVQAVSLCRDAEELTVNEFLAAVERVAAYIRDGKVGE